MDGVYSLPRMYVAALFAGAALIAAAGAGAIRGRRSWWIAVAVVAGMIAAVKAGSTVHAEFITALVQTVGRPVALITSAALAGAGIALLWVLSRHDRRDRRRVLGSLTAYAVAAVGLSAISNSVGASWSTVSTYLEEAGEGLSGVAFLVAVVVGVAPRVALPAAWPLRREVDAQTLDLPERAPGGLRDSAG